VKLRRGVNVAPQGAGLDASGRSVGVDLDAVQGRKVDDDPAIGDRRSGDVVAATTDRDRQVFLQCVGERPGGVVLVGAAGDQGRPPIDRAVSTPAEPRRTRYRQVGSTCL
jgi:hypothetical protein